MMMLMMIGVMRTSKWAGNMAVEGAQTVACVYSMAISLLRVFVSSSPSRNFSKTSGQDVQVV